MIYIYHSSYINTNCRSTPVTAKKTHEKSTILKMKINKNPYTYVGPTFYKGRCFKISWQPLRACGRNRDTNTLKRNVELSSQRKEASFHSVAGFFLDLPFVIDY